MGKRILEPDVRGVVTVCSSCGEKVRIPYGRLQQEGKCPSCSKPIPVISRPVAVAGMDAFDALIKNASLPILVDFWAAWCAPCRAVAPELEKVAASQAGRLVVLKVDTEKQADLAIRYQIRSIPTLSAFSGGREVGRISGVRPASAIESFLEERDLL